MKIFVISLGAVYRAVVQPASNRRRSGQSNADTLDAASNRRTSGQNSLDTVDAELNDSHFTTTKTKASSQYVVTSVTGNSTRSFCRVLLVQMGDPLSLLELRNMSHDSSTSKRSFVFRRRARLARNSEVLGSSGDSSWEDRRPERFVRINSRK